MSDFDTSRWADPAFSREYLDCADNYIPDRFYLFHVLRSFYRTFVARNGPVRVCDLGCGDGILTDQLLREDPAMEVTVIDGSGDMLAAAQARFKGRTNVQFLQRDFEMLLREDSTPGHFDLVMSSFAIHHVDRPQRQKLFAEVLRRLNPEGWFVNIETALPDHPAFTEWYYGLWQDWIVRRGRLLGHGDKHHDVPRQARENPDNKYSPLTDQLADLKDAGFKAVDCHYKNGIFAIYAGQKPPAPTGGVRV
jgi:tRNA (cmo5U34)-methyltransferase